MAKKLARHIAPNDTLRVFNQCVSRLNKLHEPFRSAAIHMLKTWAEVDQVSVKRAMPIDIDKAPEQPTLFGPSEMVDEGPARREIETVAVDPEEMEPRLESGRQKPVRAYQPPSNEIPDGERASV